MGCGAIKGQKYEAKWNKLEEDPRTGPPAPKAGKKIEDAQGNNNDSTSSRRGDTTPLQERYRADKAVDHVEVLSGEVVGTDAVEAANDVNLLRKYAEKDAASGKKKSNSKCIFAPAVSGEPLRYRHETQNGGQGGNDNDEYSLGNNTVGNLKLQPQSHQPWETRESAKRPRNNC
eukprot:gnl/TRDRNA2_/TRDRNA2_59090_c0_seq1.p1 gnl/TRDRNA2_/TRDRNA2_59090_c0~~gnl/TRDRNA2_/TRDRNA2_59090_c0_seq1.p1  ORF type:complete len:187 (-),score=37.51 gnl/TRDRNA2_/TRDRNA2_59090_c0_seq1:236-757(-)